MTAISDTAPSAGGRRANSWFSVGPATYEERIADGTPTGRYRARPYINRRLTWRVLKATNRNAAIREAARADWVTKADNFTKLTELWKAAGYPGRRDKVKPSKSAPIQAEASLPWLLKYFGRLRADEIRQKHLTGYATWRSRHVKRGKKNGPFTGGRTIDLDLVTLSNVLHYGVRQGVIEFNFVCQARGKFAAPARHSHAVMPPDAQTVHKIAAHFLKTVASETCGWLTFFSMFSGLRHSELLRLELGSRRGEPGYIDWFNEQEISTRDDGLIGQIHLGHRSKNGINPYIGIGPELAEMLRAFLHWHRKRFGPPAPNKTRWYFPGRTAGERHAPKSFCHALTIACRQLELPHVTPHGFRAYFATKQMRDGVRPVDIAYDMGDRTVQLIERIYVENIKGPKLWWSPPDGVPAWHDWIPSNSQKNSQSGPSEPKISGPEAPAIGSK